MTERGGLQRQSSMAILNTTTTLDSLNCWIRHFSSTADSKYRWRKISGFERKAFTPATLSGFKSFWIQSSRFRVRIQNLRRQDHTEMFSFRVRPLDCKRQNQSGNKTFRIHHKSGTIGSSLNLVLMTGSKGN